MNERVIPSGARDLTFGLPITQMIDRYRQHRLRGPSPRKRPGLGMTPHKINDD